MNWQDIAQHITERTGSPFKLQTRSAIGGGCINETLRVTDGQRSFFVKLNAANRLAMFEAEADGLQALDAAKAVKVPAVIACGSSGNQAYLILEYLELSGRGERPAATRLGEQLAKQHANAQPHFGWRRDNIIGATHQPNTPAQDWISFWGEQRLGYQLQLAGRNGLSSRVLTKGETLQDAFPALFSAYQPAPSLLHGDLWGGNWGVCANGDPVIFDPAVYCGDREADMAMTELFGGFTADFYAAYRASWPLDAGYRSRKVLYNLYHILNHFNLFGGGYGNQAESMIDQLLAEIH